MMRFSEYMPIDHIQRQISPIYFANDTNHIDRVWLVSIMHSGTHFSFNHLKTMGYEKCEIVWDKNPLALKLNGNYPYQFIHTHIAIATETYRIASSRVILILRNPLDVYKSHTYRYNWNENEFVSFIIQTYKDWRFIQQNHKCYIFQVDSKNQEAEVKSLGNWLGINNCLYKEESSIVGTKIVYGSACQNQELYDNPPSEIFELASEYGY